MLDRFSGIRSIYDGLIALGENLQSIFLLLIRLVWGGLFLQGGMGKFGNIELVSNFFEKLGIPFALQNAYIVATVETVGGALLILGLAARLATLPLIATMVIAYLTAHKSAVQTAFTDPGLFFSQDPFTYLFVCLVLFIFGAGRISLDYVIERTLNRPKGSSKK
ncbi:MAG: DoxX family protein [Parachlamydiaceae bacterium]